MNSMALPIIDPRKLYTSSSLNGTCWHNSFFLFNSIALRRSRLPTPQVTEHGLHADQASVIHKNVAIWARLGSDSGFPCPIPPEVPDPPVPLPPTDLLRDFFGSDPEVRSAANEVSERGPPLGSIDFDESFFVQPPFSVVPSARNNSTHFSTSDAHCQDSFGNMRSKVTRATGLFGVNGWFGIHSAVINRMGSGTSWKYSMGKSNG